MDSTIGHDLIPLSETGRGDQVEIVGLQGDQERRRRMMDLGLVPGTQVEVVRPSPLGDPVLYRVRSTLVALRRSDAAIIQVRRSDPEPTASE